MSKTERESFSDQFSRVQQMAEDASGDTWDLSDNDLAALTAVLRSHSKLRQALEWVRANVKLDPLQHTFVTKALDESSH